jgi:hypothetical protein
MKLVVIVLAVLIAAVQMVMTTVKLLGAVLYNVGNISPFDDNSFEETSRAWNELRTLPSDLVWVLGDIISGRW